MLHFKNCTECVCADIPLLKYPGTEYKDEHLSANYQASSAQVAHGDGSK